MSIRSRCLVVGGLCSIAVAYVLDMDLTLKPFLVILALVTLVAGLVLASWWSVVVAPASVLLSFWILAFWVITVRDAVRPLDGLGYQLLFIALAALLAAHTAAFGTFVAKVLRP